MNQVGLLCTRIRKEEKALVAALDAVGLKVEQVNPIGLPHFFGPAVSVENRLPSVLLDRCSNRLTVSMINPASQLFAGRTVNAGLAATGSRIDVALALDRAGIPRPVSALAASESAGMQALEQLGFPAVAFPTTPATKGLSLLDNDIAEALFEHRDTLGHSGERLLLLQAGAVSPEQSSTVVVVGDEVVATRGSAPLSQEMFALATASAKAIDADMCGVTIQRVASGYQVWDIDPVPEFRNTQPVEPFDPVSAIASIVAAAFEQVQRSTSSAQLEVAVSNKKMLERSEDVVLSA